MIFGNVPAASRRQPWLPSLRWWRWLLFAVICLYSFPYFDKLPSVQEMVNDISAEVLAAAAEAIRQGGIVAFPTETYYGLAVDALDAQALQRLFALKGRGGAKASALLVADFVMFSELCAEVSSRAHELAARHWPGPLTLALPARSHLPAAIVADGCVAARVSSHPVAHALVVAAGRPITATSANPAGTAPARTAEQVRAYFAGQDFHLLDGGPTPGGPPSTLVRVTGAEVEILRQGAVLL
jgi:L-threonylcarbamoyladenylate synthase